MILCIQQDATQIMLARKIAKFEARIAKSLAINTQVLILTTTQVSIAPIWPQIQTQSPLNKKRKNLNLQPSNVDRSPSLTSARRSTNR